MCCGFSFVAYKLLFVFTMFCPCIVVLCVCAHQFLADRCRKKTLLYCLKCVSLSSLYTRQEQHDVSLDLNLKKRKKKAFPASLATSQGLLPVTYLSSMLNTVYSALVEVWKCIFPVGLVFTCLPRGAFFFHG